MRCILVLFWSGLIVQQSINQKQRLVDAYSMPMSFCRDIYLLTRTGTNLNWALWLDVIFWDHIRKYAWFEQVKYKQISKFQKVHFFKLNLRDLIGGLQLGWHDIFVLLTVPFCDVSVHEREIQDETCPKVGLFAPWIIILYVFLNLLMKKTMELPWNLINQKMSVSRTLFWYDEHIGIAVLRNMKRSFFATPIKLKFVFQRRLAINHSYGIF